MSKKSEEGITAKKNENFSEWFTQVVQKCELADLRYNGKKSPEKRTQALLVPNTNS